MVKARQAVVRRANDSIARTRPLVSPNCRGSCVCYHLGQEQGGRQQSNLRGTGTDHRHASIGQSRGDKEVGEQRKELKSCCIGKRRAARRRGCTPHAKGKERAGLSELTVLCEVGTRL